MNKKKSRKKSKKSHKSISKIKLINIFLLIFLFAFLATGLSYFIMTKESPNKDIENNILKKDITVKETTPIKEFQKKKLDEYFDKIEPEEDNFEEYVDELEKDYLKQDEAPIINNTKKDKSSTPKEKEKIKESEKKVVKKEVLKEKKKPEAKKEVKKEIKKVSPKYDEKKIITKRDTYKYNKKSKPKIVILIDDVSTSKQKKAILNLGYRANMAILPPTSGHKNSAKIAQDLPFYMIHFPMQASPRFKGAEVGTLTINDSYAKIEKRVKQLRAWFPNAKYTNNHTGSVFTQNEVAMDRLFKALKKYNFIFVDSRTSPRSVAKKYAKKYGMPYIVRNTFLDNEKSYSYIQNQLKKAIRIAKKRGYAIAIGHPYPVTMKVLKESKHLLKGLEPIYLKNLPYLK